MRDAEYSSSQDATSIGVYFPLRSPFSRSSAKSRSACLRANPGTNVNVGRCSTRPIAAVRSAFLIGSGAVMLTGPSISPWSSRNCTAAT